MTTIAYRAGIMASDTRGYSGDRPPFGRRKKVRLMGDDLLGISSSVVGQSDCFLQWYEADLPPEVLQDSLGHFAKISFAALLVKPDGVMYLYDNSSWPTRSEGVPFFAVGSGQDFAMGAMAYGAPAIGAIHMAISMDPWSGYPIAGMKHDGTEWLVGASCG